MSGLVAFLEVTVEEARNLPALNTLGKGIDSYVILWSADTPKEEHKTKIHKKDENPKFNETFGFVYDIKSIKSSKLSSTIVLQFRNFKAVGVQLVGTEIQVPFDLAEEQEQSQWYKIPGTPKGEVRLSLVWRKTKSTDLPEIIKTHTGGSTKAYYNSITRTQLKKRIREGDRGMDTEVQYLTGKILESKGIPADTVYFNAFLHSSQQITFKSKPRNSANPQWSEEEFGFEIVNIANGKARDALRIELKASRYLGENVNLGTLYLPLEFLAPNSSHTSWYKLDGSQQGVEIKLAIKRAPIKVSELPVQATSGSATVSKKLIYALSIARKKMLEFGLKLTLTVSMKMAVVATRISVSVEPMSAEEVAEIEKELAIAEEEIDEEEGEAEDIPENKSLFKTMVTNSVLSLANNLKSTLKDMKTAGLTGSVGCSVILGVPMYGIEFEIGVDVELSS